MPGHQARSIPKKHIFPYIIFSIHKPTNRGEDPPHGADNPLYTQLCANVSVADASTEDNMCLPQTANLGALSLSQAREMKSYIQCIGRSSQACEKVSTAPPPPPHDAWHFMTQLDPSGRQHNIPNSGRRVGGGELEKGGAKGVSLGPPPPCLELLLYLASLWSRLDMAESTTCGRTRACCRATCTARRG